MGSVLLFLLPLATPGFAGGFALPQGKETPGRSARPFITSSMCALQSVSLAISAYLYYLPLEISAPPAPTPLSPPPHISNDTLLHPMAIPTAGKSSPPCVPLSSPLPHPTPWKDLSRPTAPTPLPHIYHDTQLHKMLLPPQDKSLPSATPFPPNFFRTISSFFSLSQMDVPLHQSLPKNKNGPNWAKPGRNRVETGRFWVRSGPFWVETGRGRRNNWHNRSRPHPFIRASCPQNLEVNPLLYPLLPAL